ncbi:MAG: glycosyltransferase [Phycisphaerae bacterium]
MYIGRLEPDSGIGVYIDAVRILTREQRRDFELHVYGNGAAASKLRERSEREALPIHFHGQTENAQRHITDSCFAFVDGRMAIQEAMARRRLVFAAHGNPLKRDYVSGESFSPYLIAVASGAELAEKVAYYVEHPEARAALVARAYQHARTLTWNRTAEAYLRLWGDRLACPRPSCSWWALARLVSTLNREAYTPKTEWAPHTVTNYKLQITNYEKEVELPV